MIRALLTACLLVLAQPGHAVEPDEILSDPVLEQRARDISAELRCVVCQNANIDASNAAVARDLRILVRERLVAGDTNADVIDYVHARYGDFVLFRPPWKPSTYLLWIGPFALLVLAAFGTAMAMRHRTVLASQLSAEERQTLDEMMNAPDA